MTISKKINGILAVLVLCLTFTGKSLEISQAQANAVLQGIWADLTTADLLLTNFHESSDSSKEMIISEDGQKYYLHKGFSRLEVDRGDGRYGVVIHAAPPASGWWYWQEDKNLFFSPTIPDNKVFYLPFSWMTLTHQIYGMTLPERLNSGQYTLKPISYYGGTCQKLTVVYPDPDSVIGRIPISHFYNTDQTLQDCLQKIYDERYPLTDKTPAGDKEIMLKAADYNRFPTQFKEAYVKKIELFFGNPPAKPHLYGYAFYDCNHRLLVENHWQVTEKSGILTDDYFLPPAGTNVIRTSYESIGAEILDSYGLGPGTLRKFLSKLLFF